MKGSILIVDSFYVSYPDLIYWHSVQTLTMTMMTLITLMTMMTLMMTMFHSLCLVFTVLITCSNWSHPCLATGRSGPTQGSSWFILTVGRTKDAINYIHQTMLLHPVNCLSVGYFSNDCIYCKCFTEKNLFVKKGIIVKSSEFPALVAVGVVKYFHLLRVAVGMPSSSNVGATSLWWSQRNHLIINYVSILNLFLIYCWRINFQTVIIAWCSDLFWQLFSIILLFSF